ncbi:helix-turn-helix domain-containing protein [Agrobacterium vitis]|uniref:Transcriptional regulator n=2 Tax=Rhizobium/Agrobacterium group TaxID=227290 RepID=B9K5B5_ALLAM|nr:MULTISPECIES: helix-turn-helix domain-containing protein [Rhizobium/Agrobacterium group]ACM40063.1 Transcriptional regulator [Allorhizobium ampelinum S4]MCF1450200.1 helix-turn-helix domain-containing protein [Allorhizobium ampelinum]MCF1473540.1 helix-turn-helix domain-containing protein [Allorhizobium ampelinum]MCF1493723.1 helix-turn-helix domain-containing protein [Allorhizobium ampelinum]MUO28462.1 helix-turn-helix domain-containing protein [Agrobacterium vitis]
MSENIRALSRGLNVLEFLSETGGATRQATVAHFGLSRPTIYRLLGTLEKSGLISLGDDGVYRPTIATRALKEGLTDDVWALWAAEPILLELQKEVVWTSEITTFDAYSCTMLKRDTTHSLNPYHINLLDFDDNHRSMLTSACGLAYLAFCPQQQRAQILEHLGHFGDRTQSDSQRPDSQRGAGAHTRNLINKVISDGYAVEQRNSYPLIAAIAVPIRYDNRVLACLSIVWLPRAVKLQDGITQFLPALKRAQSFIEQKLLDDASIEYDTNFTAKYVHHGQQHELI